MSSELREENGSHRTHSSSVPNLIEPGSLYGITEAMSRLGWGRTAMRNARRDGLEVLYYGKNAYVRGEAIVEFIREKGTTDRQ